MSHIQVTVSCAHAQEAQHILSELLKQKWVACGQIIPNVQSMYRWQGQLEHSEECLLLLKSHLTLFKQIEKTVLAHHSYDVPEIMATPVVAMHTEYEKWIDEEIKK